MNTGRAYVYAGPVEAWIDLSPGVVGPDGLSAYQVAITEGFNGTLTEWLDSLQGIQGIQGIQGPPKGDTGVSRTLKAPQGENRFQPVQIVLSPVHKGHKGPQGPQGIQGPKGDTGETGSSRFFWR